MSRAAILEYQQEIERLKRFGGSANEGSLEPAFRKLLNQYLAANNLIVVSKLEYRTPCGKYLIPDGTIKDSSRLSHGWWESKDEYDDIEREAAKKIEAGYPTENIIFENSKEIILYQDSQLVNKAYFEDEEELDKLLQKFASYERKEIAEFRRAIEKFKTEIPEILRSLRSIITNAEQSNRNFREARDGFLEISKESINPEMSELGIREMIIQHILSEKIFESIFQDSELLRENSFPKN